MAVVSPTVVARPMSDDRYWIEWSTSPPDIEHIRRQSRLFMVEGVPCRLSLAEGTCADGEPFWEIIVDIYQLRDEEVPEWTATTYVKPQTEMPKLVSSDIPLNYDIRTNSLWKGDPGAVMAAASEVYTVIVVLEKVVDGLSE